MTRIMEKWYRTTIIDQTILFRLTLVGTGTMIVVFAYLCTLTLQYYIALFFLLRIIHLFIIT